MIYRERASVSELEGKIPEAWIGQEVMIETTEALSSDLRASAPVYLEDVNERRCHAGYAPPRPESVLPLLLPLERGWLDTPRRGGRTGGGATSCGLLLGSTLFTQPRGRDQPVEKVGAELKIIRNQAPEAAKSPQYGVFWGPIWGRSGHRGSFSTVIHGPRRATPKP
jgi:hypothetical protein